MPEQVHRVGAEVVVQSKGLGDGKSAKWFVVQSKSGQELIAQRNLVRQGYSAFCPTFTKRVKHARQVTQRHKPFFPGYIFVQFDPVRDNWFPINSTIGVCRILSFGGRLAQLPSGLVERMRELSLTHGSVSIAPDFCVGDRVRVVSDTFDKWIGDVIERPDMERVTLLVDLLSRKVPVTVERNRLQKVT